MMNEETKAETSLVLPVLASVACTATLGLIGMAGPVIKQMWGDFNIDPATLRMQIVRTAHWGWTVPLGLAFSAALIAGSRRWKPKTNLKIDLAVIVLAVVVLMGFGLMAFMPIF